MTIRISVEALNALKGVYYSPKVNRLFITREELPNKVYQEVKEVCTRLGGRWNTSSQTFLFAYDPTQALEIVQVSGTMPPKNPYAHFQTPASIIEDMLSHGFHLFRCNLCEGYHHGEPLHYCQYIPADLRILEPSTGKGAIAHWIRQIYATLRREDYLLHCCELDPINQGILQRQGFQIVAENFLCYHLKPDQPWYDLIIMNPPFHGLEYIEHIEHAWNLLNPRDGRLVFIAPTNFFWRSDERCQRFRKLLRTYSEDVPFVYPPGRFKESGTPIETTLVSLVKQDLSWKMQPYAGYPNWHCSLLDSHIAQTKELNQRQWYIWQQVDCGELPECIDHPEWHRVQHALYQLFTDAIEHAKSERWIEIELDQASLEYMERHFLTYGLLNCQCERHKQIQYQFLGDGKTHNQVVGCNASTADFSVTSLAQISPEDYFQQSLFSS